MAKDPGKAKGGAAPPTPDPAPVTDPASNGFSLGKVWASIGTSPKVIGTLVVLLGGLATLWSTYLRPVVSPADVSMNATCRNDQIMVTLANSGGRTARVGLPSFTIVSSERHDALDLEPYLKERPVGNPFEIASDHNQPLEYNNPLDFFGRDESRSCHFEIRVPVEGRTQPLQGTCSCNYIDR